MHNRAVWIAIGFAACALPGADRVDGVNATSSAAGSTSTSTSTGAASTSTGSGGAGGAASSATTTTVTTGGMGGAATTGAGGGSAGGGGDGGAVPVVAPTFVESSEPTSCDRASVMKILPAEDPDPDGPIFVIGEYSDAANGMFDWGGACQLTSGPKKSVFIARFVTSPILTCVWATRLYGTEPIFGATDLLATDADADTTRLVVSVVIAGAMDPDAGGVNVLGPMNGNAVVAGARSSVAVQLDPVTGEIQPPRLRVEHGAIEAVSLSNGPVFVALKGVPAGDLVETAVDLSPTVINIPDIGQNASALLALTALDDPTPTLFVRFSANLQATLLDIDGQNFDDVVVAGSADGLTITHDGTETVLPAGPPRGFVASLDRTTGHLVAPTGLALGCVGAMSPAASSVVRAANDAIFAAGNAVGCAGPSCPFQPGQQGVKRAFFAGADSLAAACASGWMDDTADTVSNAWHVGVDGQNRGMIAGSFRFGALTSLALSPAGAVDDGFAAGFATGGEPRWAIPVRSAGPDRVAAISSLPGSPDILIGGGATVTAPGSFQIGSTTRSASCAHETPFIARVTPP